MLDLGAVASEERKRSLDSNNALLQALVAGSMSSPTVPKEVAQHGLPAPPLDSRRGQCLTASRFAEAVGLSPYATPHSLWELTTGRITRTGESTEAQVHGNTTEGIAKVAYELLFPSKDGVAPPTFGIHANHSWLGGTPDGFVGTAGLLEIKCPMFKLHDRVPAQYMAQIQGCMEIHNRQWCDFFSFSRDGSAVSCWNVPRSRAYWQWLQPKLQEFWVCVQADMDPKYSMPVPPKEPPPTVETILIYRGPPPCDMSALSAIAHRLEERQMSEQSSPPQQPQPQPTAGQA